MIHPVTGDQIVFNGEIYNFALLRAELEAEGEQFGGHSDTEVILHALSRWGEQAVARFEGMYAFAFYDHRRQRLVLARDPLGIKPLYIARVAGAVLFASEVRALLASGLVPRKLDMRGAAGFLAYGTVQQPGTIIESARSFPAGHYQTFEASSAAPSDPVPFWRFPRPKEGITECQAVETIRSTFDTAVRDHLVSDVPVGVFLSSGLDSTIIAGIAARHTKCLRSFSVGFADQPDMSEQPLASETAALFGLKHTNIDISVADAEASAEAWFRSLAHPSIDGLNVYVISKVVREHGIVVALSGQGGDELFGGYPSFRDVPRLQKVIGKVRWVPPAVRGALAAVAAAGKSQVVRRKLVDIARTDGSLLELYLQRRRLMTNGRLASLGVHADRLGLMPNFLPPGALDQIVVDEAQPAWSISQLESRFYQGNMLLRDSDANGMAHGLEIRVPFLDQRIVDYVSSLPDSVRLPNGAPGKHLLRAAFPDLLRPDLMRQAKRGFGLPIRRWMLGPLREMCEHGLLQLKGIGVFRPDGIDAVWQAFLRAPETPIWTRAFALAVLGRFADRMKLTA